MDQVLTALFEPLLAGGLAVDLTAIRGLLGVVLGVGALIFFHELGHFLAAKWAGVRVEVFSLGFGPRLFGFRHGDTDYRVSGLPLGGYVRMLGQADDDPSQPLTDREDDFRNKSVGKRFVILVAGVVMNVLLAAVGFMAAFGLGVSFTAPEIGLIMPGSAAARADLRPGDVVTRIDGEEILGWQDLQTLVALADGELALEVLRGGEVHTTKVKPTRGPDDTHAQLGVAPTVVIAELKEDSPLRRAGAKAATPVLADRILNVSPIDSRVDAAERMSMAEQDRVLDQAEGPLAVTLERTHYDPATGRPLRTELIPVEVEPELKPTYTLGLNVPPHPWVREVRPDSAAAAAGVKEGDRLLSLGGQGPITVYDLAETVREVGARHGSEPVPLVVERPDASGQPQRVELQVSLALQNEAVLAEALEGVEDPQRRLELRKEVGNWLLGVSYRADVVGAPSPLPLADPDAEPITLQPGDRVVAMWLDGGLWWNQQQTFDIRALEEQLAVRKDEPLRIDWIPAGRDELRSAVVKAYPDEEDTWADLGVTQSLRQVLVERGPVAAVGLGVHETVIQSKRIVLILRSFLTGGVSPSELGGPIQIVRISYAVATQDTLAKLFHLLAILSVNLAVINILPIPVLDGGHIFFLAVEKLKGRPVSAEVLHNAQYVGLLCILALMALVFFNDIRRWAQ